MPAVAPEPIDAIGHQPVVECDDLVVRYGASTAVDHLTMRARRGEILALLGPNGAGKTSTVETLEGYRRPSEGTVRVLGLDPVADHARVIPRIGTMLQRGGVYPMLGPRRVLQLFSTYYPEPEDPGALLELVSLTHVDRTPWRNLSGGEQQRLALALALVGRPEVVFLDEPTAGVDPEGRLAIRELVAGLRDGGACVILTTHDLVEAEQLADRVVVMAHGVAVAEGTPAELTRGGDPVVAFGAPTGLDVVALTGVLGATVTEDQPGRYRIQAAGSPELTAALANWLAERSASLTDLRTVRSLEEAYLAVIGDQADGSAPAEGGEDGESPAGRSGRARGRRRRTLGEPRQ